MTGSGNFCLDPVFTGRKGIFVQIENFGMKIAAPLACGLPTDGDHGGEGIE